MPIVLPDPDEIEHVPTGTIVKWRCPHCHLLGTLGDGFGIRCMNRRQFLLGLERLRWNKQSWCYRCRFESLGVKALDPAQPYLPELFDEITMDLPAIAEDYPLDDPPYYFEGIV